MALTGDPVTQPQAQEPQTSTTQREAERLGEQERVANPLSTLKESCEKLEAQGAFDLFALIDGVANLNPESKAMRADFLLNGEKKTERDQLKKRIRLWKNLITSSATADEMKQKAEQQGEKAELNLSKNQLKAVEAVKTLESSYRGAKLFFDNAEEGKLTSVSFMNATLEQLKDLDDPRFINAAETELINNYDRLDLVNNYGLLVVPGYLSSNAVLDRWAKIAHNNRVMMITDFMHLDSPSDVIRVFESKKHTGSDAEKSNVIMDCNWIVGRKKYNELGEEDNLYIPPSSALAGKLYCGNANPAQPGAGYKYGKFLGVEGVKFVTLHTEISKIGNLGLVPIVGEEWGRVTAQGAKTLFNGDDLGLQTYSVVRVFDYIKKLFLDYLNKQAFTNISPATLNQIKDQLTKFLNKISGDDGRKYLIKDFAIKEVTQDPTQLDRVNVNVQITPFYPAKTFLIKINEKAVKTADKPQ